MVLVSGIDSFWLIWSMSENPKIMYNAMSEGHVLMKL